MKRILDYHTAGSSHRTKSVDVPVICQFIIGALVLLLSAPLYGVLRGGLPTGAGGGLVCVDCLLTLLLAVNVGLTLAKPRARLRRMSSFFSWGAFLLYLVLSVVAAMD